MGAVWFGVLAQDCSAFAVTKFVDLRPVPGTTGHLGLGFLVNKVSVDANPGFTGRAPWGGRARYV